MRKIFMVALLMQISGAFADVRMPTAQEKATTNLEARRIAQEISDIYDNANCQNPNEEFIMRICAMHNNDISKTLILLYATEKVMMSYKNEIQLRMEQKGIESKRQVKRQSYDMANGQKTELYWLDRGDLDSKKCQSTAKKKAACDYPDGFEEFSTSFYDSNANSCKDSSTMIFTVTIDKPSENKVNIIEISLNVNDYPDSMSVGSVVEGTEYNYKEFYAWQNQTAQDIRNGMYVKASLKDGSRADARARWVMDDSREWASQNNLPDAIMFSAAKDASYHRTAN